MLWTIYVEKLKWTPPSECCDPDAPPYNSGKKLKANLMALMTGLPKHGGDPVANGSSGPEGLLERRLTPLSHRWPPTVAPPCGLDCSQEVLQAHVNRVGGKSLDQRLLHGPQRGLVRHMLGLCAREARRECGKVFSNDALRHWHASRQPGEEGDTAFGIRWAQADLSVNPAGAEDGGINALGPVRVADDGDAAAGCHAVHSCAHEHHGEVSPVGDQVPGACCASGREIMPQP